MSQTRTPPSNSTTAAAAPRHADDATLEELGDFFKYQKGRDSPSDVRNVLLVIATLMITATYQAVLAPPGGNWQDNGDKDNKVPGQQAGKTILGTGYPDYRFLIFLATNTAGFYGSLIIVVILTEGFPLKWELGFTMLFFVVGYDFAMISIMPKGEHQTYLIYISTILPLVIVYAVLRARKVRISHLRGEGIC